MYKQIVTVKMYGEEASFEVTNKEISALHILEYIMENRSFIDRSPAFFGEIERARAYAMTNMSVYSHPFSKRASYYPCEFSFYYGHPFMTWTPSDV